MRQWIYNFPSRSIWLFLSHAHHSSCERQFFCLLVTFLWNSEIDALNIFFVTIHWKKCINVHFFPKKNSFKMGNNEKNTKWLHVYNRKVKCRKYHGFWWVCVCRVNISHRLTCVRAAHPFLSLLVFLFLSEKDTKMRSCSKTPKPI